MISYEQVGVRKPVSPACDLRNLAVIVPTRNARKNWTALTSALSSQGLEPGQVLIIDSSSEDGTEHLATLEGYQVFRIERAEFSHGGTRQQAAELLPWASIVVYLTQDAILASNDAIRLLVSVFEDESVAAAYGRQLPRIGAGPIEAHARLFNYPARSELRDFESRHRLGIKATFMSNSFAAYRVSALQQVGGFPSDVIMAEDAIVAGRLLLGGWKTAYVAEAQAYHSHSFNAIEEFRRYFDTGVYHRRAPWLRESFGHATGEGKRFVLSEFLYLLNRAPQLLPVAAMRTMLKALGYRLGLNEEKLGRAWAKRLSCHKSFWNRAAEISKGGNQRLSNLSNPGPSASN